MKGKKHTKKSIYKMSLAKKGKPTWNKGKKMPKEFCEKLSRVNKGKPSPNKGKSMSKQQREKLRIVNLRPEYNEARKFFYSLPKSLTILEKRKSIQIKFPTVHRTTAHRWTKQWQSELEATQQP